MAETANIADSAQKSGARGWTDQGLRDGFLQVTVGKLPMRWLVGVRIACVRCHPYALARNVKSAACIERVDINVSHPTHRAGFVFAPEEVLGAVVIAHRLGLHACPGLAAIHGAENLVTFGTAVHGYRHQSAGMLSVHGDATVAELVIIRWFQGGDFSPYVGLGFIFPNTAGGFFAGAGLVRIAKIEGTILVEFGVTGHQAFGLLWNRTPVAAAIDTSIQARVLGTGPTRINHRGWLDRAATLGVEDEEHGADRHGFFLIREATDLLPFLATAVALPQPRAARAEE